MAGKQTITGMLWAATDKTKPFSTRLDEALAWFKEKYPGIPAEVCFVNSVTLGQTSVKGHSVKVVVDEAIQTGHLLIGANSEDIVKLVQDFRNSK